MGRLKDKVAVVTGGKSGTGARTCELFIAGSAKVVNARCSRSDRAADVEPGDVIEE